MPETDMTAPKRLLKVFLCHASTDKPRVRELYRYLKKKRFQPWFDEAELVGGQDWQLEIPKAIESSDAIIICLTENSTDKEGFVQKEIKFALKKALTMPEGRIFLIPVRFEECKIPTSLDRYRWIDLFEEDGHSKLIKALRVRAKQLQRVELEASSQTLSPRQEEQNSIIPADEFALNREAAGTKESGFVQPQSYRGKRILMAIIGLAITATALFLSVPWVEKWIISRKSAAVNATPLSSSSTDSPPALLLTNSPTLMFTPQPEIYDPLPDSSDYIDPFGIPMRLVPAGEFTMGSEIKYEDPIHIVYLDAFYIDKYEVTNALYAACVAANVCDPPKLTESYSHVSYYGNPDFNNYPVIFVDWNMAKTYCEWRGAQLPTEAQWEKAARGTDGRTYSWGEGIDCDRANYWRKDEGCVGETSPVGSYEGSASPYGAYDMTGNVWEWTADWLSATYYQNSPSKNPRGPKSGIWRAMRGGAWNYVEDAVRTTIRPGNEPSFVAWDVGFRCSHPLP
jgi:formylglycine-generating enzyme required for sulfatase activity